MHNEIEEFCKLIRERIIDVSYSSKKGHIGSTLSCVEIMVCIESCKGGEDVVLLSKGHACLATYAIMEAKGTMSSEQMRTFCTNGGLPAQLDPLKVDTPWLTGSLGNMLGIGSGMCIANRIDKKDTRVFVVVGDGEVFEGAFWESAIFAGQESLDNLVCIMDKNNISVTQRVDENYAFVNLSKILSCLNWDVETVDGHDCEKLIAAMKNLNGRPKFIIANTIKAKGIPSLENSISSHNIALNNKT